MFGITKSIYALIGALVFTVGVIVPDVADANERHRPGFRPGHYKPWPGYRPPKPGFNKPWLPPYGPPGFRPPAYRPPNYRPPYYRPPNYRPPISYYFRDNLPEIATFSVIAGVTYAVVNNLFYKRQGDQYVYVQQPPVNTSTNTITTTTVTSAPPAYGYAGLGTVVYGLPAGASNVIVNGSSYYVAGGVWYAPMAGTNQYIVVTPQA